MKGCPQTELPFVLHPLAGSRFCGTERLNRARKGLCDAGIAPRLLSAMLIRGLASRALPSPCTDV